jgi:signal transduction histidine kinase
VHRARVAHLVALERQRTRIAMDLHDEVGSGLASVGILSGVLATDGLRADARRRAAVDIATAAENLGHALSDIVWSLDPHAATLDELASRLTEHGERLTADANLELQTRFPARWPAELVDVTVRRNVLLIGLEALHNAVRHAHASEIQLALLPHGRLWHLSVQDDGTGLDAWPEGDGGQRGHGLRSIRRRADEIGARLTVSSAPGRGTTIALLFSPRRPRGNRVIRFADRLRRSLPTAVDRAS